MDSAGELRVYDWEFASEEGCVSRDYLTNVLVYDMALRQASRARWPLSDLFLEQGDEEIIKATLARRVRSFEATYGIPCEATPVYLTYSYLSLLIRHRSEANIMKTLSVAPEICHILEAVDA